MDFAIQTESLGKRYRITRGKRRVMLREALSEAVSTGLDTLRAGFGWEGEEDSRSSTRTLWALHKIDFRIQPGESVGIIGRNGAGKTTLLKILARVTAPTEGRARLRGRVGSLLEVGTGFHPELTGRENVFLNGAVLGMRRREIERKFDEIVDFSGVEDFLETPVKFYSSGMRMRLAFSVAAHLEPEILLVDEVLAVGDAAFQQKCLSKMGDVVGNGRTVLFVSHNMAAVRALCESAIYLEGGRIAFEGDVASAIDRYLLQAPEEVAGPIEFGSDPTRAVQIRAVSMEDEDGNLLSSFPHDRPIWTRLTVAVRTPIYRSLLAVSILDAGLDTILTARDVEQTEDSILSRAAGTFTLRVRLPAPGLIPGKYWLKVQAVQRLKREYTVTLDETREIWPFEIYDNGSSLARLGIPWKGKVSLPVEWQIVPEDGASRSRRPAQEHATRNAADR